MQDRAHTPDATGIDMKYCEMHLSWWNWVKMPTVDSKVSCLDLVFWERGSSSFLLGTELVHFRQLGRQSEKNSQDYKDHVSMVILIRNLSCSRIDRSEKQNKASRVIYLIHLLGSRMLLFRFGAKIVSLDQVLGVQTQLDPALRNQDIAAVFILNIIVLFGKLLTMY